MITANIDPAFDRAFPETCKRIGCNPLHLLAVMMSESEANPAAHNPHGDASGLIQFMPSTLVGMGWRQSDQAFRCLSASGQLPYVEAYYRPWRRDAGEDGWISPGRLYQATFLPGTLRSSSRPEDIIAAHGGQLGWAFDANSVFDKNGDKSITLSELTDAANHAVVSHAERWLEITKRIGLESAGKDYLRSLTGSPIGVVTAREVQVALNAAAKAGIIKIRPLVEDGIAGPATTEAIREFQTAMGILSDGKAGPVTRQALYDHVVGPH